MTLVEVGPRDGLQNEATPVPTDVKLRFITALAKSGLKEIEATSFVSPKWIPQLGDAAELWSQLPAGPLYSALVPNQRGLDRAVEVGVERIALFTAASDAFTQKNINMTVGESLDTFRQLVNSFRAQGSGRWIRGYVSTVFECPYAGKVDPAQVSWVVDQLFDMGVDEVSLGDTIGMAVPVEVRALHPYVSARAEKIAWHFHDTNGTGIANVAAALDLGYARFDASAGGLGGCPYAPGAGGNVATEDVLYFLERSGIATGIDLDALSKSAQEVLSVLGRAVEAKSARAALGRTRCAT